MKAIDSILKILVQQGATELRLASNRPPRMFHGDTELPLTLPLMSSERIRELLDHILGPHAAALQQQGQLSLSYSSGELGPFALLISEREDATLEVCFRRGGPDGDAPADQPRAAHQPTGGTGEKPHELPAAFIAVVARAAALGASDIHFSPLGRPIVRVNGVLRSLEDAPKVDAAALAGEPDRLHQLQAGGSVDRAFEVPAVGRVRVNIYAATDGVCAAVRILKREAPTLAALNLPSQLEALTEFPHGLVVACGPTGCGKSSTLAALVQHALRVHPQVLVSLEDPIEYVIRPLRPPGLVRQREVGTHVRDFATGLRDALREDPDILLIGEMRDAETISLALTAAETGHLVFASLHSRTAPSAVERIVDTYPPERQRQIRVQLADALRAVISQRLMPTADGSGRVPAVELLKVTHGVANLIREGRTAQIVNALQAGRDEGMIVLERHLAELIRTNRIRRETALAVANDATTLGEYLRAAG